MKSKGTFEQRQVFRKEKVEVDEEAVPYQKPITSPELRVGGRESETIEDEAIRRERELSRDMPLSENDPNYKKL